MGDKMRMLAAILLLPIAALAVQPARSEGPPAWAYPVNPPDFKPVPDDGKPRSVPDSRASYTVPQTRDLFLAPVWHPEDHAALPDIVAHGRKPDVFACGFCHRRMVKAARKMLTSPDCQRATLFNRWRTTKAE